MNQILGGVCLALLILFLIAGTVVGFESYNLFKLAVSDAVKDEKFKIEIARLKSLRQIEIMVGDGLQKKDETLKEIRDEYGKVNSSNLDSYLNNLVQLQNGGNQNGTDSGKAGNSKSGGK